MRSGSAIRRVPVRASKPLLQQEITIAVHDVAGHAAAAAARRSAAQMRVAMRILVIVADPALEQIAEDVERLGARRRASPRNSMNCAPAAGSTRIQMQIGDEQRGQRESLGSAGDVRLHCTGCPSRSRRHALCAQSQRRAAPGQCAHGAVQLPAGAQARRALRAAHRGHRRRRARRSEFVAALCSDLRWLGLELGRGSGSRRPECAVSPVRAWRALPALLRAARARAARLSVLLHAARARAVAAQRSSPPAGRRATPAPAGALSVAAARRAQWRRDGEPSLRFRVPARRRDRVRGPGARSRRASCPMTSVISSFVARMAPRPSSSATRVDDALMQVTHVLRGEDHLTNTPRQRLLLEALALAGAAVRPRVAADSAPTARRSPSATAPRSVRELREAGYSSAAVCNHLFRLGHSSASNRPADAARRWPQAFELGTSAARAARISTPRSCATGSANGCTRSRSSRRASGSRRCCRRSSSPREADAFIAAVLPNVVLAEDARVWQQIIFGEALQLRGAGAAGGAGGRPGILCGRRGRAIHGRRRSRRTALRPLAARAPRSSCRCAPR